MPSWLIAVGLSLGDGRMRVDAAGEGVSRVGLDCMYYTERGDGQHLMQRQPADPVLKV